MHRSPWFGIPLVTITLVLLGLAAVYPATFKSAGAAQEQQNAQRPVAQAEPTATAAGHSEHHPAGAATPMPEPTAVTETVTATMPAGEHAAHHPEASAAVTATTPSTVTGMMDGMSGMMDGDMAGMHASMSAMMPGMMAMMQDMMQEEMPASMHSSMEAMHEEMMQMHGAMMGKQPMDMAAMHAMMSDMQARMASMAGQMPATMAGHMQAMADMMGMMAGMMDMMEGMGMMQGEDAALPMPGHDMAAMGGDASAAAGGHDMAPVSSAGIEVATEATGGQPLAYREEDGVKVFELTAKPALWPIMQGVTVTAWTYNGVLPGPMIRVTEGDRVRVIIKNELPEATSVHWHGVLAPNAMDGVVPVTQPAIQPGEVFTYEFEAKPAGSFMYHSHVETDKQIPLGLYAPFIIDPAAPELSAPDVDVTMMLSEWRVVDGETYPAMPLAGMEPNYFTINGKAFPNTEAITVKKGSRVRIRLMGIGQFVHPMHLHGLPFQIVATDGYAVPEAARLTKDTISVAPGERYDIEFVADALGTWMLHCHIPHHITNDGVEPGGLAALINVVE